ncbi:LamG-like jellyroll fold domain-containing protein [Niabella aurantiaca]|uniref:LamG-like jellyroll fold domain-containing protein n=1 Tax=Niabella aurantiaca TaxID=379900 RepID=UPI00037DDB88|nr:LamG-like jellyroll fold domain-containing protein [Niabella aurantiaca]
MNSSYNVQQLITGGILVLLTTLTACKKDGNPNKLPSVSPKDYEGLVDGFSSSEEIYPDNLVAYWSFDGTATELKSGTSPAQTAGNSFFDAGVRGKALKLNAGYLYYAKQFGAFKKGSLKSFTISEWIQILNNGTKRTMIFQIARPGIFNGDLNFRLNTHSFPASNVTDLKINPYFVTVNGTGTQDNINTLRDAPGMASYFPYVTPQIGADVWVHLVLTYNGATGYFDIWANGIKAGAYASRGTGNNLFTCHEPNEVIIGGNYNTIPGMAVDANADYAPMTGSIDELRVYNTVLPDAFIKALYNLGKVKK